MRNCNTCVFLMGDGKRLVCAGRSDIYGMDFHDVIKIYPEGCVEYEPDLCTFIENEIL